MWLHVPHLIRLFDDPELPEGYLLVDITWLELELELCSLSALDVGVAPSSPAVLDKPRRFGSLMGSKAADFLSWTFYEM